MPCAASLKQKVKVRVDRNRDPQQVDKPSVVLHVVPEIPGPARFSGAWFFGPCVGMLCGCTRPYPPPCPVFSAARTGRLRFGNCPHQSPPSTHLGDEVLGAGLEQVLQLLGVHVHGPQLVPQHRGVVGSDQGGGVVPHLWSSRGREVRTRSARGTAARRGVSPQGRGEYPAPRSRRQTGTQHAASPLAGLMVVVTRRRIIIVLEQANPNLNSI